MARDPFFIIGERPRPDLRLADLAGLRFASVSEVPTPWICLQDDIRRAGVDPASLNRIADKTMDENEAALRAGTVDAIQVFQPYAERLIASGAGHVWNAAASRGLTAYTTLVTRRDVLARRADDLLKRLRHVSYAGLVRQHARPRHRARPTDRLFPMCQPDAPSLRPSSAIAVIACGRPTR